MPACACGKQAYHSAAAVYQAISRQQQRVKRSAKSRGRLRATQMAPPGSRVQPYRCRAGVWHMGHDTD